MPGMADTEHDLSDDPDELAGLIITAGDKYVHVVVELQAAPAEDPQPDESEQAPAVSRPPN